MNSSRPLIFLLVLLVLAGTFSSCAGTTPRRLLDQPKLEAILAGYVEPEGMGIYAGNHKIGWIESGWSIKAGSLHFFVLSHTELTVSGQTVIFDQTEERNFEEHYPWRLLSCTWDVRQNGEVIKGTITCRNGGWVRAEEGKPETSLDLSSYSVADVLCPDILMTPGPSPGFSFMTTGYNVSETLVKKQVWTLKSRSIRNFGGIDTPVFLWNLHEENSDLEVVSDQTGHVLKINQGAFNEYRREDVATVRNLDASIDLFEENLIYLDAPLGLDPWHVTYLRLTFPDLDPAALPSLPGQEVRQDGKDLVLTLVSPRPGRPKKDDQEIQEALRSDFRFPAGDVRIRDLADQATKRITTSREKTQAIRRFVSNYIVDSLIADSVSIDELLKRRKGDCSEHSRLYVTLARAAGIPAREVYGFYYLGDERKAFGGHAWVEAFVDDEWVMLDPVNLQASVDALHITTGFTDTDFSNALAFFQGKTGKVLEVR